MTSNAVPISEDLLASKGKRFLNHLIDLVPQYAIFYGIDYGSYYLGEITGYYAINDFWYNMTELEDLIFNYGVMILYYFFMEKYTSRTLGKYITKTIVVTTEGEAITTKHALSRTLCRLIPFDGISFLGVDGKGWHDSISKTYVVNIDAFEAKKQTQLNLNEIGNYIE